MRESLAAAIALFCLGTTEARAQTTARDSLVLHALSRFEEGDRIRVALLRSAFVGAYMGTRGDTLFFGTPAEPPMGFRFNAVDSLWRIGNAARRGAWMGTALGAVAGLVYFAAARNARTAGTAVVSAGIGALGGAATGAVIGSLFSRWHLVYGNPRPEGFDLVPPTGNADPGVLPRESPIP